MSFHQRPYSRITVGRVHFDFDTRQMQQHSYCFHLEQTEQTVFNLCTFATAMNESSEYWTKRIYRTRFFLFLVLLRHRWRLLLFAVADFVFFFYHRIVFSLVTSKVDDNIGAIKKNRLFGYYLTLVQTLKWIYIVGKKKERRFTHWNCFFE